MWNKSFTTGKVLIPGGILSPGDLRRIVNAANHFGMDHVHVGDRQEILLEFDSGYAKDIAVRFKNTQYQFERQPSKTNNIVSSYTVKHIAGSVKWLTEDLYREILNSFSNNPSLKVNIVDPKQSMFPLFAGELNFIASDLDNYWYLFVKLPHMERPSLWPVLVDGREIASLVDVIDVICAGSEKLKIRELEAKVYELKDWTFKSFDKQPEFEQSRFLYYEGIQPMGEARYWLGIYERLNQYPIQFLDALCMLCNETEVATICLTPYKSLIIKNIAEKHIPLWLNLLGKYKINTGHSSLEVNFLLPELDKSALQLRKFIFNYFDNKEVRSDGLVFELNSGKGLLGGSILVEKKSRLKIGDTDLFDYYNISYRKKFNANSEELISFAEYVKKRDVPETLILLCEQFHREKDLPVVDKDVLRKRKHDVEVVKKDLFQCPTCLTIYDPEYGDSMAGAPAGMPFELLPDTFCCALCEAPKKEFRPIDAQSLEKL